MENIVEYIRRSVVSGLFQLNSVSNNWGLWQAKINQEVRAKTASNILSLGDKLSDVFETTRVAGRSQNTVSTGGTAWEGLVCWYLNLCLIGTNTVVIRQNKKLMPAPISDSLTVNYGTFTSNTESDLVAITFPDDQNYQIDKNDISVLDDDNQLIPTTKRRSNSYNYQKIINSLTAGDFDKLEVCVIQCKTNWNDNAQIPMLWDMIYYSTGFSSSRIQVGRNGFTITDLRKFRYAFMTVPTVNINGFKADSTAVQRVRHLSGGNFWGHYSKPSVAHSIKEIFNKNFSNAVTNRSLRANLGNEICNLDSTYSYFQL
ncbi:hypothetical protein [Salinicoccus roseus]|uniref:hypothetical protein n=1 Tax=Salinicoccus roseus TaxID=45670 RepID=UPI002300F375|nr:hypothetical protein [Salinicoccus roseus]